MNQVLGVEHWHAREILERAVDEIEVVARPAYARISVESWQHGILETLSTDSQHRKHHANAKENSSHKVYLICFLLYNS